MGTLDKITDNSIVGKYTFHILKRSKHLHLRKTNKQGILKNQQEKNGNPNGKVVKLHEHTVK